MADIVHEQQYKKLHSLMEDQIQCNYDKQKAIEFLEEFISGFQGLDLQNLVRAGILPYFI